jgi:hypothetical protein
MSLGLWRAERLDHLSLPKITSGCIGGAGSPDRIGLTTMTPDCWTLEVIDGVINFAQLSPCDGFIFFSPTKKLH